MFIVRTHGEGTITYCYFDKEKIKKIKFKSDHPQSQQDAQLQEIKRDEDKDKEIKADFERSIL